MDQIESVSSKEDTALNVFSDIICKIDRILRIYKMTKYHDSAMLNDVRQRVKKLMKALEAVDKQRYSKISQKINKFVQQCLAQQQKKKVESKTSSVNGQSSKSQQKISSLGSINQKKQNTNSSQSQNIKLSQQKKQVIKSSSNSFQSLNQENVQNSQNKNKKEEQMPMKTNLDFNRKESSSSQLSGSMSDPFKTNINLKQYCQIYSSNIQSRLAINQQIMTVIKGQNPEKVLLLGVQKPTDKNTDKLYISTYMQFTKQQVSSIKFKVKDYQFQLQQFLNIIRYPLILCIIGNGISDMKIHYIKFLLEMTSPIPIVIIFNQINYDKSIVIRMSDKVVSHIEGCNMIEMDKMDSIINMKDKSKYKCINLKDIPVSKDRVVTTKFLQRKHKYQVIENNQAIMVEKTNQKIQKKVQKIQSLENVQNVESVPVKREQQEKVELKKQQLTKKQKKQQEIKQQNAAKVQQAKQQGQSNAGAQQFRYILHSKFFTYVPPQNFVYYISQNNEITTRKKTKSIEQSTEYIKSSNTPCIIGYSLKGVDKRIPPLLLINFIQLGLQKCVMIMLRVKTLTLNKMALICMDSSISEQQIQNNNITFKDIEEKKVSFIRILLIGQKTQFAKYQGKNVMQEI